MTPEGSVGWCLNVSSENISLGGLQTGNPWKGRRLLDLLRVVNPERHLPDPGDAAGVGSQASNGNSRSSHWIEEYSSDSDTPKKQGGDSSSQRLQSETSGSSAGAEAHTGGPGDNRKGVDASVQGQEISDFLKDLTMVVFVFVVVVVVSGGGSLHQIPGERKLGNKYTPNMYL